MIIIYFLLLSSHLWSQELPEWDYDGYSYLWGKKQEYLHYQHHQSLRVIDTILSQNPPSTGYNFNRYAAFLLLDQVMHDPDAPEYPSVIRYIHEKTSEACKDFAQTEVDEGALIWKLYNHGFLIKTPTVSFGFDVVTGSYISDSFAIPLDILEPALDECDFIMVSHHHNDHFDVKIVNHLLKMNKTVIMPEIESSEIQHTANLKQVNGGIDESINLVINNHYVRIKPLPGHQGYETINNIYHVTTPEGLTFVQTGDQSHEPDLEWMIGICNNLKTDVILINCWMPYLNDVLLGFNPSLIITGHHNELAHGIDHRESFWLTHKRLENKIWPWLIMEIGEKYNTQK